MNIFAKFDENPAITLQVIKKTKRYGRTDARTDGRTDRRTDNVKTVYHTTSKVCGGYKDKTKVLMTNGSLMQVESFAVCSNFRPALSDNWSGKPIFGLFESGRFRQVLLYCDAIG